MLRSKTSVRNLVYVSPSLPILDPCSNRGGGCIHVAWFLFGLPSSFDPVKAQILVHKELPTLSEIFNCLHQASISDSSTKIHPHSFDRSAFNTIAGGYGNRGRDQEGG